MARARGLEPLTLRSEVFRINIRRNIGINKDNIISYIINIHFFSFPHLSPFFASKCDKIVTCTHPRVPPPLLILKISESSNFFPEKIQDLSPRVFTSIFTLLFFNVETLKIMSSIVVANKLMLNSSVG